MCNCSPQMCVSISLLAICGLDEQLWTSSEKAKSWVRELQRQADPSVVIMLVGNKLDLEGSRKTPREIGEQFAKEEGLLFTEASAKSGHGVQELFIETGRVFAASLSFLEYST